MEHEARADTRILEIDLGEELEIASGSLDPKSYDQIVVHVPLPTFGSTQSYIDICGDLLDASWAIERMAARAKSVRTDLAPGDYRRIRTVLIGPRQGIFEAIADCALLFNDLEDSVDNAALAHLQDLREQVCDYEDGLETFVPRAPGIIDWYLGSTPILRTLSLSPILGQRSVHVQAQALQP